MVDYGSFGAVASISTAVTIYALSWSKRLSFRLLAVAPALSLPVGVTVNAAAISTGGGQTGSPV